MSFTRSACIAVRFAAWMLATLTATPRHHERESMRGGGFGWP